MVPLFIIFKEQTLLTSGCPVPQSSSIEYRGEGVAIVLTGLGLARLVANSGKLSAPDLYGSSFGWMSMAVRSFLLHTNFFPAAAVKDMFFDELRNCLSSVPAKDYHVLLGGFNARVGSSSGGDDNWRLVRECHKLGHLNGSGRYCSDCCPF